MVAKETNILTQSTFIDEWLIGQKLEDCLVESLLGRGGMATVFKAIRDADESYVAIKVISPQFSQSQDFLTRFEREAKLMLAFEHPHILKVYHYGTVGNTTYLQMDLLEGGSLGDVLDKGPLPLERATDLLQQISDALDYAHDKGVIHRDLKPDNVLLNKDGNAFLTDFGIAKWKEETAGLTLTGMVVGTPSYMAPEQWRTEPVDARTDVYALGVMTFELLTGKVPFIASTPFSLMYRHLDEPPPQASRQNPAVPRSIDRVIQRAMAKIPERRYPTAGEFALSFKEALLVDENASTAVDRTFVGDMDSGEQTFLEGVPLDDGATSVGPVTQEYNSIDVGARTLLSRAREAVRETQGDLAIVVQSVITHVQDLREQSKYQPRPEESPYKSLESYDISDNRLFFGREEAIDEMLDRAPFTKFSVLHAESGAGKTSLIRAGLMPRLLAGGFFPVYVAVRRRLPHEAIKHILLPDISIAPHLANAPLRSYLKGVSEAVGPNREIFIFLDQFETFFTDVFTDEERSESIRELAECLDDTGLQVRIIIAMRTEYFGLLASFQPAIPQPFSKEFLLRRLTLQEAERAMTLPVEALGYEYEEGLVRQILEDLADDSGEVAPPQLQLVGTALIESLPDERKMVTKADYDELGGAKGVLRSYLERLLERLPTEDRRPARVIIESLVRADQTRDVRTQKSLRNELKLLKVPTKNFEEILRSLRENHVLRLVETDEGMAYELVHDYLALQVELDPETTARKAAQELLNRRVRDYEQYGSLLTREEYEVINAQRERLRLEPKAEELITRTRNMIQRQRRIAAILVISTVLGILGVLALIALVLYRDNENRQDRIEAQIRSEATIAAERDVAWTTESRMLSDLSQQQLQQDTVASLNLAIQALTPRERPYVPEAEYALTRAVQSANERAYMPSDASVARALWSADETKVLTWSSDGTSRIFASATGEELVVMRGEEGFVSAAWSPDEAYVLMGQKDGTVRIFDAETGEIIWLETLQDFQTGFASSFGVSWNPSGDYFAIWSAESRLTGLWHFVDGEVEPINLALQGIRPIWSPDIQQFMTFGNTTLYIWDQSTGELFIQLSNNSEIDGAQWNSNGTVILGWLDGETLIIWDTVTGTVQDSVGEVGDDIMFAAFSPDDSQVAFSGFLGTIGLWDLSSDTNELLWTANTGGADSVVWLNDGTGFLTVGTDALHIWDALTGDPIVSFDGYARTDKVETASLSPSGNYLLTDSVSERFARIWNAHTGEVIVRLYGHNSEINSVRWSSDETEILTSGVDGAARIWSLFNDGVVVGYGEIYRMTYVPIVPDEIQHDVVAQVLIARWNEDESLIATGHSDATVRIWDAQTFEEIHILQGHYIERIPVATPDNEVEQVDVVADVYRIVWSPDQTRLASASNRGRAIIWDVETGEQIAVLEHPDFAPIWSISWSADGERLLTSSDDGAARIWDAETGEELLLLQQNTGDRIGLGSAIWNSDETRILTAGDNGYVHVWNAETGEVLLEVEFGGVPAFGASWNRDETLILAWGEDNQAHVLDARTGEEKLALVGHGDWVITASWSPDESRILTTSLDLTGRIWDAKTGELQLILAGHTDNVTEGIWNQDGSRVMTRSVDGTVRVWDTIYSEDFAEMLQLINGHSERVNSIMWNSDETRILTASGDGTARVWQSWRNIDELIAYAQQFVTRPLSPEQRDVFFLPPVE